MTPNSIRTGRQFDSATSAVVATAGANVQLATGDANRVGLVVALPASATAALDGVVAIGPVIDGALVPLTTLSSGHPVCYLSVDKIGSALFPALFVRNGCTGNLTVGVTTIRQVQELP